MSVDGGQLVSLITIHCGAVLFDVDGLLDFASSHRQLIRDQDL